MSDALEDVVVKIKPTAFTYKTLWEAGCEQKTLTVCLTKLICEKK